MPIEVAFQAKELQMQGLILGDQEFSFVTDHGQNGVRELSRGVDDPAIRHQHRLNHLVELADPDDRVNAQGDDQDEDQEIADDQPG